MSTLTIGAELHDLVRLQGLASAQAAANASIAESRLRVRDRLLVDPLLEGIVEPYSQLLTERPRGSEQLRSQWGCQEPRRAVVEPPVALRCICRIRLKEVDMRKQLIVFTAALTLVSASTALAGGWATVKLSSSPKGLSAGEPWVVDIRVLQHGLASQPLCCLSPTVTIRKVAAARSSSSSSAVSKTFRARSTGRIGFYRARVVFPSAGTWRYEVFDGFTRYSGARTHKFAPVEVAPSDT